MKVLHCRDAGFDCDAVVQGEDIEQIMAQVRPHAESEHGVTVTPEMERRLAGIVREEPA